ncbi:MAG: penicillin-binding protein, partial [Alphaproteobacteria bacterium]|nr:penicillin-binding protein [Alphaproteobacteria bacterium]
GGLSVRTTLDPRLQGLAKQALMDGLVAYDRRKGWRGPAAKIDIAGDWGLALGKIDSPRDIQPWRLGVVLDVTAAKAVVGLKPAKSQAGKFVKGREAVEIKFAEMKWAKAKGKGAPKSATSVLNVGDVIYVAPKDSEKLDGVWTLMQIPEVSGGLVAMDPHTGRVLAIAGGFSFDMSQFDRAVQAKRQPGSSFKPVVYAAALDNGYKPTSIILDAPIEIEQGPGKEVWRPENYRKNSSYGPTTLRTGIEKSRNQMTVRLAQDMGMPLITEYARRFGVYEDLLPVLSMSLGAGETTLLRMVTAYSVFANGGKRVRATLIDRIQDRWGKSIWQHDRRTCSACVVSDWSENVSEPVLSDDRRQIIDPHTAFQITSMLEGVVQRGTATSLKKLGMPLAGKTGTTNEEKDAWFIGYSPDLVVGVYVGFDTPKPMGKGQTGGKVAAPIFGNFMKMAQAGKPATPFRVPPGIRLVQVNPRTGLRANPGDPNTTTEAFKPNEYPDDAYSVVGFSETTSPDGQYDDSYSPDRGWQQGPGRGGPGTLGPGRGGLW